MKKFILVFAVILSLLFSQAAVLAKDNAAAYLEAYYGITFGGEVSMEDYNIALTALGGQPLAGETFTLADAVVGAVRLADMEELAITYTNEKAARYTAHLLDEEDIIVDEAYAPYIACALDLELIDDDYDFNGPIDPRTAASLLYRAAEICGKGRHYIGELDDDELLAEVKAVMDSVAIFDDETMSQTGINILVSDAATGYSLKYRGYDARFLEENTLRYSHDDQTHILQLLALLQREDYDAYVQIEPKVSVYEYMPEWGDPGEPTATYAVREMTEGRYFAFALEFELVLEFETAKEKEAFHETIETYAKKYDDRVDSEGVPLPGLLYSSWWQPMYYSLTPMKNDEFVAVIDNVITSADGSYTIRSIGLPEQSEAIAAAAREIVPDADVIETMVYVNPAFYRYLTDTDHQ